MTKLIVDLEGRVGELEKQREQRKVLWTRPTPPADESEGKVENGVQHENGVGKELTVELEVSLEKNNINSDKINREFIVISFKILPIIF